MKSPFTSKTALKELRRDLLSLVCKLHPIKALDTPLHVITLELGSSVGSVGVSVQFIIQRRTLETTGRLTGQDVGKPDRKCNCSCKPGTCGHQTKAEVKGRYSKAIESGGGIRGNLEVLKIGIHVQKAHRKSTAVRKDIRRMWLVGSSVDLTWEP